MQLNYDAEIRGAAPPSEGKVEDLFFAAEMLEKRPWTFGYTMPLTPHWHTVQQDWDEDDNYQHTARIVLKYGAKTWFQSPDRPKGNFYRQLPLNGYTYWPIMNIINRRRIYYGSAYEELAFRYDELYPSGDPDWGKENYTVRDIIGEITPDMDVLDVGSGTGLLHELFPALRQGQYTGIEPCILMTVEHVAKYPQFRHRLITATWDDYFPIDKKFDLVIAMFASGEGIREEYKLKRILKPGGRAIIMRYGLMLPEFWQRESVSEPRFPIEGTFADIMGNPQMVGEHELYEVRFD